MPSFSILKNSSMPIEGRVPPIALKARERYNGVIAIKVGFCWRTFIVFMFFGSIFGMYSFLLFFSWAFSYRIWLISLIGALSIIALNWLIIFGLIFSEAEFLSISDPYESGKVYGLAAAFIVAPFLSVIFAFNANHWRVMGEKKRGYERVDTIKDASSKKDAVRKYLIKNSIPFPSSWLPPR